MGNAIFAAVERCFKLLPQACLAFLLLVFMWCPGCLSRSLDTLGIDEVKHGDTTITRHLKAANEATKEAAGSLSNSTITLTTVLADLDKLKAKTTDPHMQAEIDALKKEVAGSLAQAEANDTEIKKTIVQQQDDLQALKPDSNIVARQGWLYLGHLNQDQKSWVAGEAMNVKPVPAPITTGQTLVIETDTYLHDDVASGEHRKGPVLAVVTENQRVKVLNVDPKNFSHAVSGGWYVWARVEVVN